MKHFGFADYFIFTLMLFFSSIVGIYFAIKDHRKKNTKEISDAENYLMGGRKMQIFPVAMSLTATVVSGISLLGTSTEIYLYGTQYCLIIIAIVLSTIIINFMIIPVLHELQITSTYEYLEARFDKSLRLFGAFSFTIVNILWLPIVIYVPAIAFNQTTGINIHIITPISMSICIFYTSLGGLKAVVWTDVLQISLMYGTLALIAVKGTISAGGISEVITKNKQGSRIEEINFNFDPTIRHTFWTLLIGGTFYWTNLNGLNQSMIQRFLSLSDVHKARKALLIFTIATIIMLCLCMYNGLLLYANYYDCDPLTANLVKAKDQMMPLLAMETLSEFPGLSGLFVSGVFSAALSSASTALNSMSAVVLEDFCGSMLNLKLSKRSKAFVVRGTVVVLGILTVLLVYVVQNLGAVLQLAVSIIGACGGPLGGIFVIGFLIPSIKSKSTFYGGVLSVLLTTILVLKSQMDGLKLATKEMRVDGCAEGNFTDLKNSNEIEGKFYQISYLYYTLFGSITTILIAYLLSFFYGFQKYSDVDQRLIAPFMRRNFDENKNKNDYEIVGVIK